MCMVAIVSAMIFTKKDAHSHLVTSATPAGPCCMVNFLKIFPAGVIRVMRSIFFWYSVIAWGAYKIHMHGSVGVWMH